MGRVKKHDRLPLLIMLLQAANNAFTSLAYQDI